MKSGYVPRKKRRTWILVSTGCFCFMLIPFFLPGAPIKEATAMPLSALAWNLMWSSPTWLASTSDVLDS